MARIDSVAGPEVVTTEIIGHCLEVIDENRLTHAGVEGQHMATIQHESSGRDVHY